MIGISILLISVLMAQRCFVIASFDCDEQEQDVPFPSPYGDCDFYYVCVPDGSKEVADRQSCRNGQHFSPDKMTCLYPDEALCLPDLRKLACAYNSQLLSHPANCSRYFECSTMRPTVRECPDDLHFSSEWNGCVSKGEAGCDKDDVKYCSPYDNPWRPTLLPDPTDCAAFYKCHNGQPLPMLCPNYLYFSVVKDRCEFPFDVECKNGVRPKMI